MSEENPDKHQDHKDGGDLEDENDDSELDNSNTNHSGGGSDPEESNSLDDNELHEDQEIEDEYNSQNPSNANELSTSDDLSNDHNEDYFELNSTNNNSNNSSYFAANDQSVNEVANKEGEIREQLDLYPDKPLLDEFFDLGESPIFTNKTVQSSQQDLPLDNSERIVDESLKSLTNTSTGEEVDFSWSGRIFKGGGGNTGFVTFPKGMAQDSDLNHGDRVKLRFHNEAIDKEILVDTQFRVAKQRSGFYIPKGIMNENDLMGNNYNFSVNKEEGFATKISEYKQVIIPQNKLEEFHIKDKDIINLTVRMKDGNVVQEPVIVQYSDRSDRKGEHVTVFRNNDVEAGSAEAKIEGKLEKMEIDPRQSSKHAIYVPNLFPDGDIGRLDEATGILFKGRHTPIDIPLNIDIGENAHYMGCYFADGTKQGHAWRMSASTPEQVMYYNSIYDKLLPNEEFKYNVVYSKTPSDTRIESEINRDIKRYWEENTNNSIKINKVYQVDATVDDARNRNEFGSLEIRNHKGLVMQFHQKMLDHMVESIKNTTDKDLLWKFVHGVFEGDGYVAGGADRFGLGISCNIDNYKFVQGIFDKIGIQYRVDNSKVDNGISTGVDIQFGLFEVLNNFGKIKDDVFQFYPKRADRLFDRMREQSTIRHILGDQSDSNFVRGRSREFDNNEIIDFFKNRG